MRGLGRFDDGRLRKLLAVKRLERGEALAPLLDLGAEPRLVLLDLLEDRLVDGDVVALDLVADRIGEDRELEEYRDHPGEPERHREPDGDAQEAPRLPAAGAAVRGWPGLPQKALVEPVRLVKRAIEHEHGERDHQRDAARASTDRRSCSRWRGTRCRAPR